MSWADDLVAFDGAAGEFAAVVGRGVERSWGQKDEYGIGVCAVADTSFDYFPMMTAWHEAVEYNQAVGFLIARLWLAVPVTVVLGIALRRWVRPEAKIAVHLVVLSTWVGITLIYAAVFLGGLVYYESINQYRLSTWLTGLAVFLASLHLLVFGRGVLDFRGAANGPKFVLMFTMVAAASTAFAAVLAWFHFGPAGRNLQLAGIEHRFALVLMPMIAAVAAFFSARYFWGKTNSSPGMAHGALIAGLSYGIAVASYATYASVVHGFTTSMAFISAALSFGVLVALLPGAVVGGLAAHLFRRHKVRQ